VGFPSPEGGLRTICTDLWLGGRENGFLRMKRFFLHLGGDSHSVRLVGRRRRETVAAMEYGCP